MPRQDASKNAEVRAYLGASGPDFLNLPDAIVMLLDRRSMARILECQKLCIDNALSSVTDDSILVASLAYAPTDKKHAELLRPDDEHEFVITKDIVWVRFPIDDADDMTSEWIPIRDLTTHFEHALTNRSGYFTSPYQEVDEEAVAAFEATRLQSQLTAATRAPKRAAAAKKGL